MKSSDIKYIAPPVPRQVRLDTVNFCNAKCRWCHILDLKREKTKMSLTKVEEIVTEIAQWPQPPQEFVGVNYGEMLIHEEWFDILKLVETKLPRTRIVFPTNGALLDWEKLRKLLSIKTFKLVNLSINAAFDHSYEELMGLPAANIVKLRNVVARIRQDRPDVAVWASMVFSGLWVTDLERDKFIEFWRDVAVPQINTAAFCGNGEKPWRAVKEPCRSLFSDMVIGADGKIGSCCYDAGLTHDLGQYPQDGTLLEIWNGPKFRTLREVHNGGKRESIPICAGCSFA
mgnify:CR=1 FL=1